MKRESWRGNLGGIVEEEESWERNHRRASWNRHHGIDIMGKASWERNHGKRHHGRGIMGEGSWKEESWEEAPKRLPGGSPEAPRRPPEAPRRLPGGSQEAPRRLPGGSQGNQASKRLLREGTVILYGFDCLFRKRTIYF